jgi:peptidoglycan/LPS O-acetylase OafA/YrhL
MTSNFSSSIKNSISIFNSKGIVSLDLLRGLVAYSVIIPHFFLFYGYNSKILEFSAVFAVEVFFILSGFVLGPQLERIFKYPTYENLKIFYSRRWMRTIPIYLVIMLSVAVIVPNISFDSVIKYLLFIFTWTHIPNEGEFFFPAWSLAVEEWFYLIFPLILITFSIFKKKQIHAILFFLILFLLVKLASYNFFTQSDEIRRVTFFRLDAIAYGYLTYLLTNKLTQLNKILKNIIWISIPIFILISYQFFINNIHILFVYSSAIAAILILVSFRYITSGLIKNDIIKKSSAFLAHTSYSVYLIHFLLFTLMQSYLHSVTTGFFIYITIIIILAVLSFYIIEKPILELRPNYNIQHKIKKTFKDSFIFSLFTNLLAFIIILFLAELSSNKIKHLYSNIYVKKVLKNQGVEVESDYSDKEIEIEKVINFKITRDKKRREAQKGSSYYYESYVVFKNKEFKSETLNIQKNGRRKTLNNEDNSNEEKNNFIIWVLGASPIYGATNSDNWTIPSRIQYHMQKKSDYNIIVRNYGVMGYSSWQMLTTLQMELMKDEKPDMVFAFGFNNDYLNLYNNKLKANCSHLFTTALGSKQILERSWNNLANKNYIFYEDFFRNVKSFFPATNELSRLLFKVPLVLENKIYPEIKKDEYRKKRDIFQKKVKGCFGVMQKAYLNNNLLMAELTNSVGATFIAGILPELRSTKKTLFKHEITEKYGIDNYFVALTDQELLKIDKLPYTRLNQNRFENKIQFEENLYKMKEKLNFLARQNKFYVLDFMPVADESPENFQLFASTIHFTNLGSDYLVENKIHEILKIYNESKTFSYK